jgi:hypothetical protein
VKVKKVIRLYQVAQVVSLLQYGNAPRQGVLVIIPRSYPLLPFDPWKDFVTLVIPLQHPDL